MNLPWLSYGCHLAAAPRLASCLQLSQLSWVPWPSRGFAHQRDGRAAGAQFSGCATPLASLRTNLRIRGLRSLGCLQGFGIKQFIGPSAGSGPVGGVDHARVRTCLE